MDLEGHDGIWTTWLNLEGETCTKFFTLFIDHCPLYLWVDFKGDWNGLIFYTWLNSGFVTGLRGSWLDMDNLTKLRGLISYTWLHSGFVTGLRGSWLDMDNFTKLRGLISYTWLHSGSVTGLRGSWRDLDNLTKLREWDLYQTVYPCHWPLPIICLSGLWGWLGSLSYFCTLAFDSLTRLKWPNLL